MNWVDESTASPAPSAAPPAVAAEHSEATENSNTSQTALFAGDVGELPLDTRRVLVQLLSGPTLEGRRHAKLWTVLLRDELAVQRHLNNLFLELVIDREAQVAFTRQAEAAEHDVPMLLRQAQLTFIDSVLVLFLRQRLTQAETHGDRAVIDRDEIVENLVLYQRAASTDRAGFTKRINASVEKIKKHNILQKIRGSEERFEISPTLKLLFSAEEIAALTQLYEKMAAGEAPDIERQPLDGEDEE